MIVIKKMKIQYPRKIENEKHFFEFVASAKQAKHGFVKLLLYNILIERTK